MLSVQIPEIKSIKIPVGQCTSAINRNHALQSCLLLETTDSDFTITAVDQRTSELKLRVPGSVISGNGSVIVNADSLNTILSTFDQDEQITIIVDENENKLVLVVNQTTTEIPLAQERKKDFPLEEEMPAWVASVNGPRFGQIIKQCLTLLAEDKQEFITFKIKDELELFTSCKGRLFSRTQQQLIGDPASEISIAVPMVLLGKLPLKLPESIDLCYDPERNLFAIVAGPEHLIIRPVVADNLSTHIDKMINEKSQGSMTFSTGLFKQDLKRAIYINDPKGLTISPEEENIKLSCGHAARASIKGSFINYSLKTGDLQEVKVDPKLISRALAGLNCSNLTIEQVPRQFPAFDPEDEPETFYELRMQDDDQPGYIYVICTTLL